MSDQQHLVPGVAAGALGAIAVARMMRSFGDVSADDLWLVAPVALLFGATTAVAALVPARRALAVHPREALRAE